MTPRAATNADLPAIAALHSASWQDAYAGLMPEEALGPPLVAAHRAQWSSLPGPDWLVLVVEGGDGLHGFIAVRRPAADDPLAYVDNLHVRPDLRGSGRGLGLLRAAARQLLAEGTRGAHLTVLAGNAGARRFYRRLGAVEELPEDRVIHDTCLSTVRVVFPDLRQVSRERVSPPSPA